MNQRFSNLDDESAFGNSPKRIDLHCHSDASNEADEAVLNALDCPESFSAPPDVYRQAKRGGMDFVTITDHDSIAGVTRLRSTDILIGEEVTCFFPEDHCKIHLLVWGITGDDHDALQAAANNIYELAALVERRKLAHAVAHPVYRQNDRLERWHIERLTLMFKGFETLNGAHSALHRQAVEEILSELSPEKIAQLSAKHGMAPRGPFPTSKPAPAAATTTAYSTSAAPGLNSPARFAMSPMCSPACARACAVPAAKPARVLSSPTISTALASATTRKSAPQKPPRSPPTEFSSKNYLASSAR